MKYDLVIAYRIYPGIAKVPPVYQNDKYNLSRLCLKSFKNSLSGLSFKIYVLLDNCPDEYENLFTDNFDKKNLEILKLNNYGNKKTFKKQLDILLSQKDSDIVYFAEDDYFYIEKMKNMIDLLKSGKADFVSPYEHPACYNDGHVINNSTIIFNNRKYITVQHACMTFMTTKKKLEENKRFFLIYPNWFASDFVLWGCMTLGFSYFKYLKLICHVKNISGSNLKVFGSMWFFAWYRFMLNRRNTLYMPTPTIATHMESNFLSPGINWNEHFNDKDDSK
jgi:hypothetical protein